MILTKPDIFGADSYRSFLKEFYEQKKKINPRFSFQSFARLLGLKSRSYIQLVISGQRNIGLDSLHRFSILFGNQASAFKHFKKMVLFELANHPQEKAMLAAEIRQARRKRKKTSFRFDWYTLYSDWYYFPIYFLAELHDFVMDASWIQKQLLFPLNILKINEAMKLFLELGLWKKVPLKKGVQLSEPLLKSNSEKGHYDVLKQYHKTMLSKCIEALELERKQRIITGLTLTLSENQYQALTEEIDFCKDHIFEKFTFASLKEKSDKQIYQVCLSAFPITRRKSI